VVPVLLLLAALLYLKDARAHAAGVATGLAMVAKLSMGLAAPFLLLYLWVNKRTRDLAVPFAAAAAGALLLAQGALARLPRFSRDGLRQPGDRQSLSAEPGAGAGSVALLDAIDLPAAALFGDYIR